MNPAVPFSGVDLSRMSCWWLTDDLLFLGKRYYLIGQEEYPDIQEEYPEIIDLSKYPEDKQEIYAKTARTFCFKLFDPKESDDEELISSDSDLDSTYEDDDFYLDSTQLGMLDSTLDFVEDEEEMNKIIAFFAKMPKVTGLVQGMIDMVVALTRILPLVMVKLDEIDKDKEENQKLKSSLGKVVDILNLGLNKVLKLCAYLGIKVEKKQSAAIGQIVKNRFKKDKKDFLEYEIDELNKSLDDIEKVNDDEDEDDEDDDDEKDKKKKPLPGQIPIVVKENHLYPQKMPVVPPPKADNPIVVVDDKGIPIDKDGKPVPPPKPPPAKVYWLGEDGKKIRKENGQEEQQKN